MIPHRFPVRVYYEDTDLAGIVYYANYLKFIERARSEWVRELGVDQRAMKAQGIVFVARRVEADYIAPAVFEDDLIVETTPISMSPARLVLRQLVLRREVVLFRSEITLVVLGDGGKPRRLPDALRHVVADILE
jgi:acyl-CoA thioester hydrolase